MEEPLGTPFKLIPVTIRLTDRNIKRVEQLIDPMNKDAVEQGATAIKRAEVMSRCLVRGLDELEKEYGVK